MPCLVKSIASASCAMRSRSACGSRAIWSSRSVAGVSAPCAASSTDPSPAEMPAAPLPLAAAAPVRSAREMSCTMSWSFR